MHILMVCMINNNNLFLLNYLIGLGIVLSPLNNYYKIWCMKKVYFIIHRLNKLVRNQYSPLSKNLSKLLKIMLGLVLNINSTNDTNDLSNQHTF